jgi:hypothetical protein
MLKYILFLVAVVLGFAAPAQADVGACQGSPSVQAFKVDRPTLERKASFINLWWSAGRPADMSFEEAFAVRTKDIENIYSEIETARRDAYSRASCLVVSTKKCASTAGRRHECPMNISPPANMRFEPSTIELIDDDFEVAPTYEASGNITYTVKKTGRGSNTAGFRAIASYTSQYIDQQVANELASVHQILDPLFVVVTNSNSNN